MDCRSDLLGAGDLVLTGGEGNDLYVLDHLRGDTELLLVFLIGNPLESVLHGQRL